MSEIDGEDAGEGLVRFNPIGVQLPFFSLLTLYSCFLLHNPWILRLINLQEYYGGRNDKNERHGRGRAILPNGDLYLGCYFRGKRYGLGVYRYKNGNGSRYGGDWVNGLRHGWGTMLVTNFVTFFGKHSNNG